jgi:hypothetical protein
MSFYSNVLVKNNSTCLSCPRPLAKMTIPFYQCEHFNQVGPFEKSHFLIVFLDGFIIKHRCGIVLEFI